MNIALIGYGEVGRVLAEDLAAIGHAVTACDRKLDNEGGNPLREHAAKANVVLTASHTVAAHGAELVLSAVTASQAVAVAQALEAMVIESFTMARHHGVEDAVIASLHETFPGIDWETQAAYFFQRAIEHGRRRSEEVREVAVTVREAGLEPHSAVGTAARQAWVADLADAGVFGPQGEKAFARNADWRIEADRILMKVQP